MEFWNINEVYKPIYLEYQAGNIHNWRVSNNILWRKHVLTIMENELCPNYSCKRIQTHHYSSDQKFMNSGNKNCVGNNKLSDTGHEFNIFKFGKAKGIAISVDLTMDSDKISSLCFVVISTCDLFIQINTVTSGF